MFSACSSEAELERTLSKNRSILAVPSHLASTSTQLKELVWTGCFLDAAHIPIGFRLRTRYFFIVKSLPPSVRPVPLLLRAQDQVVPEAAPVAPAASLAETTEATVPAETTEATVPAEAAAATTRGGSRRTGYGLDERFPDFFLYDPTPHLLIYLTPLFSSVSSESMVIRRIVTPANKRSELRTLAAGLSIVYGQPITMSAPLSQAAATVVETVVEAAETVVETKLAAQVALTGAAQVERAPEQQCLICCNDFPSGSGVSIKCCNTPDLCTSCFYRHLFESLGRPFRCMFCTKPFLYAKPAERPGARSALPLANQLTALRLLQKLAERIDESGGGGAGYLILAHKFVVQKYFGSAKKFTQALDRFNGGRVQRLANNELPDEREHNAFVFVYDFVSEVPAYFAHIKMSRLRLVVQMRALQDENPIDDELFETLSAARVRNIHFSIIKMFVE